MDDLDRQIAGALQIDGRATWRQIAASVGRSESTVARRGRQLLASRVLVVTGQPDLARTGLGQSVIIEIGCRPVAVAQTAERLVARPDVRYLTRVAGDFDLLAELVIESSGRLADVLDEIGAIDGVERIATDFVLRTQKSRSDWNADLFGPSAARRTPQPPPPGPAVPRLDATDYALLQLLRQDGRRSSVHLAGELGLTESRVRRRVKALVDSGCLSFLTIVDPRRLGFGLTASLLLRVDPGRLEQTAARLSERREVRYLAVTSGNSDVFCELIMRSSNDLLRFTAAVLGEINGLRETRLAHHLVTPKRGYLLAGDDRLSRSGRTWDEQPDGETSSAEHAVDREERSKWR